MRRADTLYHTLFFGDHDSSPPAKGRPHLDNVCLRPVRFIPSCEGQASVGWMYTDVMVIHPFLRGADLDGYAFELGKRDSSLPTKGRHSVFMRLSAALNTSLCNLHKCHSCLIHVFNMPKNPPHFHFFSNYFFCFSTPITRDIPAPYDLDRPTPFLIKFRNAFASLTRSRNSYPNTLTG